MSHEKKTESVLIKHFFTNEEKLLVAEKQSAVTIRAEELEDEFKSISKDYKSRIETANLEAKGCARKIADGYEMQRMDVCVERDMELRIIKFIDPDTGELLEERPMSIDERQLSFT
jgi:ribosomal protein S15P/S13E